MQKKIVLISIALVGILSIAGLIGFQFVIQSQVQNAVDKASIDVSSISILDIDRSSMDLSVEFTLSNPTGVAATLDPFDLAITYQQTTFGSVSIKDLTLGTTDSLEVTNTTLAVSDTTVFNSFVHDFLLNENVTVGITGVINLHAKAFVIAINSEASVKKSFTLTGAAGFSNITVENMHILNTTDTYIGLSANVIVVNPTNIELTLSDLAIQFNYSAAPLGNFTIPEFHMQHGINTLSTTMKFNPSSNVTAELLVSNYLSDVATELTVTAEYSIDLLNALHDVQFTATLTGAGNVSIGIDSFAITDLADDTVQGTLNATLNNPTTITGNLSNILLDVKLDSQNANGLLGTLTIAHFELSPGANALTLPYNFSPDNASLISELAADYIAGESISLIIHGSKSGNTLSALLHGWSQTITIQANQSFKLVVNSVGLINSTATNLNLEVGLNFYNPTDALFNLTNVNLGVLWQARAVSLGAILLPTLDLNQGWNNQTLAVALTPDNSSLITDFISVYLSGGAVILEVSGLPVANGSLIDKILTKTSFTFELPSLSPLDIAVISLELLNASSGKLGMEVTIEIANPSATPVTIDSLIFSANYSNVFLGNITLSNLTVNPGKESYIIDLTFSVSNSTLLEQLLTDYLNGESVIIHLSCSSASDDILSAVIKDYVNDITLPSFSINPTIGNFTILDSSNDTLTILLDLELENPTNMNLTINDVAFDLYYQGIYIGNLTLPSSIELMAGINTLHVNGTLTSAVNQTNLENFLSMYITGHETVINVKGNVTSDFSGLLSSNVLIAIEVNVPIAGITEDLISSITVTSISVNINTYSYTVDIRVVVHNPLGFAIDVLDLTYDVYFNDKDGASIPFVASYGAKDNIFIGAFHDATDFNLAANANSNRDISFTDNNMERAIRLNDEKSKGQLKLNILNGIMQVQIGAFIIDIPFEFYNVPVS